LGMAMSISLESGRPSGSASTGETIHRAPWDLNLVDVNGPI
jgi:hypothetical protein